MNIKRNEAQYTDIERFKDYELTNNIAFEMMIRNNDARHLIEIMQIQAYRHENIDYDELENIRSIVRNDYYYNSFGIDNWLSYYNFSIYYKANSEFVYSIHEPLEPYFADDTLYINDEYKDNIYICSQIDEIHKEVYEDVENGLIKEGKHITNINKYVKDAYHINHNIFPSFSRPLLKPPANISKFVNLESINLSLSDDELLKYIKHIKSEFSKNHEIIKTPFEILGEKVYLSKSSISRDKNKTMQEKFADLLFIYDALKIGIKKNIIQRSIVNYYTEKYPDRFIPNMDYSTINNYFKIATEYIENLKYKELINPSPIKN